MTARKAFAQAWRVWKAHPLDTLRFLLVELCLRGIALAHLFCLTDASLRWGAVLALPLWLLIVPVARQNAALAMAGALKGGALCTSQLISCAGYGRKLARGLRTGCWLLLFALPVITASVWLYKLYTGEEAFTVLRWIMNLGGGSLINGIKLGLVLYCCTLIPLIASCAWHCGDRHALAQGEPRLPRRRHGRLLRGWLIGLVPLIPFTAVAVISSASYIQALINSLADIASGSFTIPKPDSNLYIILAAAVVLLLPAIPLKQLIPAALMADAAERRDAA